MFDMNSHNKIEYLQMLLNTAFESGRMKDAEIKAAQEQLFDLLEVVAQESLQETGVRISVEKAGQLLSSICYQISYALVNKKDETDPIDCIQTIPFMQLYRSGHQMILDDLERVKQMHADLTKQERAYLSRSLKVTVTKEIPEFIESYDSTCKAHELLGMFDYPLSQPVKETTGIGYVLEYLKSLTLEEAFLQEFEDREREELFYGFSKEYDKLSVNLFDLVVQTVLGGLLLGKTQEEIKKLDLNANDLEQLKQMLKPMGLMELEQRAKEAVSSYVSEGTTPFDIEVTDYLFKTLPKIVRHCHTQVRNHTLQDFFFQKEIGTAHKVQDQYEQEARMDTKELQKLIKICKTISNTQDKLRRIRSEVMNCEDLMEVLSTCVYGEEAKELFLSLSDLELAILMVKVLADSEMSDCTQSEESLGWHMELLLFLNEIDSKRRDEIQKLVGTMTKL